MKHIDELIMTCHEILLASNTILALAKLLLLPSLACMSLKDQKPDSSAKKLGKSATPVLSSLPPPPPILGLAFQHEL